MARFRLLPKDFKADSFMKMAVDEAVMVSVASGLSPNTLRFYRWKEPAVSVGYFQEAEKVVNVGLCRKDGVEIFRRLTGGGAVYKDPLGELNYSVVVRDDFDPRLKDVLSSYDFLCRGIVLGLEKLSLKAEFAPINDVLVMGRKVSGNAQTRLKGVILQHGTILIDVDPEKMFTYLNVNDEKIRGKMISNVKERVTSLNDSLKKRISFLDVEHALVLGFSEALGADFFYDKLSLYEKKLASDLYNKYSKDSWNFWR